MTPSILDESFRYVPAAATSVADTWRRFGWRPITDEERRARRQPAAEIPVDIRTHQRDQGASSHRRLAPHRL